MADHNLKEEEIIAEEMERRRRSLIIRIICFVVGHDFVDYLTRDEAIIVGTEVVSDSEICLRCMNIRKKINTRETPMVKRTTRMPSND